jgi:2-polyprenyl-3-methyl-5-hydroxy-6-metoxy-1,4-benzoquinol methylase
VTACHVCSAAAVETLHQAGARFRLVSSDAQPVEGTAGFCFCPACGTVQKAVTPAWRAMTERIYARYDINHQGRGAEPMIFDSAKGSGPRSLMLLRNLLDAIDLPDSGRLLDIGCSNGNLLKSFHGLRPAWKLSGSELSDTWREAVTAMPGVERFYSGLDPDYAGPYDLVSLSHVLEHVTDPAGFLRRIAGQLGEGGRILIAVPDLGQNPMDLLIADHCTHFDNQSLASVAQRAGLAIDLLSPTLLPKELIAVLSRAPRRAEIPKRPPARPARTTMPGKWVGLPPHFRRREGSPADLVRAHFSLIGEVREAARHAATAGRAFGIMGSSIAACWLMQELEGRVGFFVDEDRNRVGHDLAGIPILAPDQVPRHAVVFIPMSPTVAHKIIQRWQHLPVDFRFAASTKRES